MSGQAWKTDEAARPKARNGFAITVTGTRAVTLHLRRMGINPRRRGFGKVMTDGRLRLRLVGHGKLRKVVVPPGEHRIVLSACSRTGMGVGVCGGGERLLTVR